MWVNMGACECMTDIYCTWLCTQYIALHNTHDNTDVLCYWIISNVTYMYMCTSDESMKSIELNVDHWTWWLTIVNVWMKADFMICTLSIRMCLQLWKKLVVFFIATKLRPVLRFSNAGMQGKTHAMLGIQFCNQHKLVSYDD